MRSPLTGAIATVSIFVPLVAVPILALFGMPQLPGMSATTQSDDLKFVDPASPNPASATNPASANGDSPSSAGASDGAASGERSQETTAAKRGQPDPFADFVRTSASESGPHQSIAAAEDQTSPPPTRPQHETIDEGNGLPQKSLIALGKEDSKPDSKENSADTPPAVQNSALNWKGAVNRLNALGIRDFQLQPGVRDGEFHFSCRFVSRTNPRITRRFEAESPEPLDAVAEVLRQIDDWKAGEESHSNSRTAASDRQPKVSAEDPFTKSPSASAVNMTNR